MAFDRLPQGLTEADTVIPAADALSAQVTPGAKLFATGRGFGGFGAGGFVLEVEDHPVDGFGDQFDAIVQTAVEGAGPLLVLNNVSGTFVDGETITDGTTGATAIVSGPPDSAGTMFITTVSPGLVFGVGNTITGGTSGATADVTSFNDGSADWLDTNTRQNNISAAGVFNLQITDPVLDKVRLRLDAGGGTLTCQLRTHWTFDRSFDLI